MKPMIGKLIVFKKNGEDFLDDQVLTEVTDVEKGDVEIAFTMPIRGERVYLKVSVAELMDRVARWGDDE